MPRITSRDYANLALGGQLDALLAEWKGSNTYDEMVLLLAERGVTTSRETIRRWMTKPETAAS